VQLDFARDEQLPESPVWTLIPRGDGGRPTAVRTASRDLSLAWKLLWLHIDSQDGGRARGKDLYDAVLLAEAVTAAAAVAETEGACLPPRLLWSVFRRAGCEPADALDPDAVLRWDVDWAAFLEDYPWVQGTAEDWLRRLARALRTMIARRSSATESDGDGHGPERGTR
jgi:hypothetical protein